MLHFGNDWTAREKLNDWLANAFTPGSTANPFSFTYGGESSRKLLCEWTWSRSERADARGNRFLEIRAAAPDGLTATIDVRVYTDFPAVEWLLGFEYAGSQPSALIENAKAMDLCIEYSPFRTAGTQQFGAHDNILYYHGGSDCKIDDFVPLREVLHFIANKKQMHFGSVDGRPTSGSHGSFPYFDMQTQQNGAMMAIGWSGQWEMDLYTQQTEGQGEAFGSLAGMPVLHADRKPCLRFAAGIPDVHILLNPGEKIRLPRILLMPWVGDRAEAHNTFRRFMLAYHTPQIGGKPVLPPVDLSTWGYRQTEHMRHFDALRRAKLPFDTYWIDAGWYGPPGTKCDVPTEQDWAEYVGYWDHDPTRYPDGLKPVSDAAHALGLRFLLWLEPDRAMFGTPETLAHPEFFLGKPQPGRSLLFNLGREDAYQWMLEKLSGKIREYGIDVLRIDYNIAPLSNWNQGDSPDRRGMTQIRCVENFYRLWDELLVRFPGLMIDNCASGGRRLDFEALSRSVPLFRSDYACYSDHDPIGVQIQCGGLAGWVPVSATACDNLTDLYRFRSTLSQGMNFGDSIATRAAEDEDFRALALSRLTELERARMLFYGDYYPFTGVTMSREDWFAYELYRPDLGRGMVVSIRRDECPFEAANYLLRGLDPLATYELKDADTGETWSTSGEVLMRDGLRVTISERRSAKLTWFTRKA